MVSSKKPSSAINKSLSGKDKVTNAREYGEGLVGSRVRIWWPLDRQFYEGVVESYASSRRKHRVLYDDGDKEDLNMNKQRWEFIEQNDAKADEISIQEESADASSDVTPEPKSEASSKKPEDSEEKRKKPMSGEKKAETSKDDEKQTTKPEIVANDKMGDIGGKIVAAASRMSERFRSKENDQEKETPKSLKTSKKVSERSSFSSEAASEKVKKQRISLKKVKSKNSDNGEGGEDDDPADDEVFPKALKSSKKVLDTKNPKLKRPLSSTEVVSEEVKKPRTSSEEVKGITFDKAAGSSDDESQPLVSYLKKLKGKKEKVAAEGSARNETEVVDKSS